MWVREFHVDGLRLDAVQTIYDFGARHILADIQQAVQQAALEEGRTVHVIAETDQNDVRLVNPPEHGGYALDAVWSDDFHHSVHALLTGQRDGYFVDFGEPAHLAKAISSVFVYDGCYSPFHRRCFGSRVGNLGREKFVVCLKNHDQVGNRARGDRPATYLPPAAQRLACGLLLLAPFTPLIFMGEEYGETRPFPFFCSFQDPALIKAVREGRRREFEELNFEWGAEIPDPQSPETFSSAVLTWSWAAGGRAEPLRRLYQTLLTARREWAALRDRQCTTSRLVAVRGTDQGDSTRHLLVFERGGAPQVTAWANLQSEPAPVDDPVFSSIPLLTTEEERFGGTRSTGSRIESLLPYELAVFAPEELL
jgi:maltooligosyltrehalose trehalohydrolase